MKKIRWRMLGILAVLTLPLALSGCQQPEADVGADPGPQAPHVMYYYTNNGNGLINTEGTMLIPPDNNAKYIYYNRMGDTQEYLMVEETIYDPELRNRWDEPTETGAKFHFYDPYGQFIRTVDMSGKGDVTYLQQPLLEDGLFLCNNAQVNGTLQVLRMDGSTLLTKDLGVKDLYGYAGMTVGDTWLAIDYNFYNNSDDWYDAEASGFDFYDMNGRPLTMAQDYTGIWTLYDYDTSGYHHPQYFQAHYTNSQGIVLSDVLDRQGNVVLSGFTQIHSYHDGLLICERGNERGMMDMQGNWLYKESLFNQLDD